jgi:MFS family permease
MGWSTLATGAQNALEVRNWKVHLVASTSALVRKSSFVPKLTSTNFGRTVGYETSVIGGTTAHDSFRRDFGLADAAPSHRDTMVVAGRTVAGLGIGACVPVYISETASPSLRGRLIDILEIASHGGGMLFGSVTSNGVGHSDPGLSESWIPSRRCHSATQRWRGGGLCWAPSLVGPRRAIRRRA